MATFDYKDLPQYKELISTQEYIPNSDFNPVIVDNVLEQKDIDHIMNQIDNYPLEEIKIQRWGGQGVYDKIVPEPHVKEKLTKIMSDIIGEPMILEQASVVKYNPKFNFLVKLFPHYDTRPVEMFIMDIQLKTNEDWGVVVEGKQFNLKDNQSLIFSGTNQMHWREKKVLPANTDINMMFCWFTHTPPKAKPRIHDRIMRTRSSLLMNEADIFSDKVETEIVNSEVKIKPKDNAN
jgi:hypothetical protein